MANLIAGRVTTILDAKNTNFHKKIKQSQADLKSFGKESQKASKATSTLFKAAAVTAFAVGLAKAVKVSVTLAANLEQIRVSFATMVGSRSGADQLITSLKEMAKVTPFTSSQLFRATKSLLAFGVASGDVTKTLKLLGDISAGTGKDISELAIIFGKIRSNGRLMGQELNQLVDAGFNPLQIIAQKTGKSMRELKSDMAKGLITFDQVENAFKSATTEGGQFFNLMEKQSQTLNGKMSTLKDNFTVIGENIGKNLIKPLKEVLDLSIKVTDSLSRVSAGKGSIGETAAVGAGVGAATVIGAGVAAGVTIKGLDLLGKAMTKLAVRFTIIKVAATNLTRLQLALLFQKLGTAISGVQLTVVIATIKEIGVVVLGAVGRWLVAFGAMTAAITAVVLSIVGWLVAVKSLNDATDTGLTLWDSLKGSLDNLYQNTLEPLVDFINSQLTPAFIELGIALQPVKQGLMDFGDILGEGFDTIFTFMSEKINTFSRNVVNTFTFGKFGNPLEDDISFEGPEDSFRENQRTRSKQNQAAAAKANSFDIDIPLNPVLPTALEKLRMAIDELTLRFTREALNKKVDPMRTPSDLLEKAHGLQLINTITPFAAFEMLQQAVSNQMAFDPFGDEDDSKKSFKLAGAFAKGSVEANRVINQREENPNEKQVVDNTALTAELLGIMNNSGIKLQNVEVAN